MYWVSKILALLLYIAIMIYKVLQRTFHYVLIKYLMEKYDYLEHEIILQLLGNLEIQTQTFFFIYSFQKEWDKIKPKFRNN